MKIIVATAIIIIALALSLAITGGLVWLVCWAFGWTWSWKIALGVWAVSCLVSGAVKATYKN